MKLSHHLILHGVFFVIFISATHAQNQKIVIMGSSTSAGQGASSYQNSWAGKITSYYNQNTSDGMDTSVINISHSGYTTYHEMPTSFIPPAGRPLPDPNNNVTKALSYNPDIILINLPTNDVANGYTKQEVMNNFRLMYETVINAGVKCFIATSQPRSLTTELRDSLRTLVDSIKNTFGSKSMDFWTDVATADNYITAESSFGDGIHLNDVGHNYLYLRVLARQIFAEDSQLPVTLTGFGGRGTGRSILLNWHTTTETDNRGFSIERSMDGTRFITLGFLPGQGSTSLVQSYSFEDTNPLQGNNYYRLKQTDLGGDFHYSPVVKVYFNSSKAILSSILPDPAAGTLWVTLYTDKKSKATVWLTDMNGRTWLTDEFNAAEGEQRLHYEISRLPSGMYVLQVHLENAELNRKFMIIK